MRPLLSPTKTMTPTDIARPLTQPQLLEYTEQLRQWLVTLSPAQQQALWKVKPELADENRRRFMAMPAFAAGGAAAASPTAALYTYVGIQYQYLDPESLDRPAVEWLQEHARILSGFYGALRPLDGILPYRLEMQTKGAPEGYKNLYAFWGDALYRATRDADGVFLNLASNEYAKAVKPFLSSEDTWLTCAFLEREGDRLVQKGVYSKMARGRLARFLTQRGATSAEEMKEFSEDGYRWDESESSATHFVFVR